MNVRIFWVRAMECMCAQTSPRFILSFERVLGNGVRTHVSSKGKILSTGGWEEGWTCDTTSCRTANPTHYQQSYSLPPPLPYPLFQIGNDPHTMISYEQSRLGIWTKSWFRRVSQQWHHKLIIALLAYFFLCQKQPIKTNSSVLCVLVEQIFELTRCTSA